MLAPSATSFTPAFTSFSASASSISFCVAQGSAISNLASTPHGRSPSVNLPAPGAGELLSNCQAGVIAEALPHLVGHQKALHDDKLPLNWPTPCQQSQVCLWKACEKAV